MAYQNVGTPRFYCDNLSWWKSLGVLKAPNLTASNYWRNNPAWIGLNPSTGYTITSSGTAEDEWGASGGAFRQWIYFTTEIGMYQPDTADLTNTKMFSAVLGHNLKSIKHGWTSMDINADNTSVAINSNVTSIVNDSGNADETACQVNMDGFSIITFDPAYENIGGVGFVVQGY